MPNWVSNSVRVTGSKEELQRFAEQAGKSYTREYQHYDGPTGDYVWTSEENQSHLSFWNFVTPEDAEAYKNNWYDWNLEHWGVKWDATDVYFDKWSENELAYDFETPWGAPFEVYQAMVAQYPSLKFTIRFLEEQGWGGEALGENGEFAVVNEWDIPETHEERMEYIGYCWCEEMRDDETDYMFDDCPRKMELANATTV
jgi:hypothetical protein